MANVEQIVLGTIVTVIGCVVAANPTTEQTRTPVRYAFLYQMPEKQKPKEAERPPVPILNRRRADEEFVEPMREKYLSQLINQSRLY